MKSILLSLVFLAVTGMLAAQDKPEPIRPALIVIDVQNQFVPMVEEREKAFAFNYINGYIGINNFITLPQTLHFEP